MYVSFRQGDRAVKMIVLGGFGLIGAQVVAGLRQLGHDVVAASPRSGVNAVTGEGLDDVLTGADVLIDFTNSPSFADDDVMTFFDEGTKNLLEAETRQGVGHHVVLSIVGCDQIPDSGYMRAKTAQERRIVADSVPYTILRATQFFEFLKPIGDVSTVDGVAILPPAPIQPLATEDVVARLIELSAAEPVGGIVNLAGPERFQIDEVVQTVFTALGDNRPVTTDPDAKYFGANVCAGQLVPHEDYVAGKVTLQEWLSRQQAAAV